MPQLPENWWMTVLVVLAILCVVGIGYLTSRPIKKLKPKTTLYYGGTAEGSMRSSSIPPRPIIQGGIDANAKPLKDAPRRSMHRSNDTGYYPAGTLRDDPYTYAPPIGNDNHAAPSHSGSGYSSGGFGGSDSGSGFGGGSDGGSSGGGDGGGGGGGD